MEKIPKFTITKVQKTESVLFTMKNGFVTISEQDSTGKTFEEIYTQVAETELANRELAAGHGFKDYYQRFMYYISEYEVLTDNRSIFGHEDQTTKRELSKSANIFVAGKLTTLEDFFASDDFQKLGARGRSKFYSFMGSQFGIQPDMVEFISHLSDIKFIYIAQEATLESDGMFYWKFEEGKDIYKPFDF
ncbi:MAG: hypothetical protein WCK59_04910 [Candidatus Falkowbacteria bacterium]